MKSNLRSPDPYQVRPQPHHSRLISQQVISAHASARERCVNDVSGAGPKRDVRHAPPLREEQQIAGFVAFAYRRHRDLLAGPELLIAVTGETDAARAVH